MVADRIRAEIPIVQVLYDYGYHVSLTGEDREQQFSCDLHGSGKDQKPSARVYPESSSFHCFGCGRSRDALTLVREKENIPFWQAVRLLENRYGLTPLPWEGDEAEAPEKDPTLHRVDAILHSKSAVSLEDVLVRIDRLVDNCCRERTVTAEQCAAWWEARDKIEYSHKEGSGDAAIIAAYRVLNSIREFLGVSHTI